MPIISWNDMFSTGIPEIDDQHGVLVGLINRLHDAMTAGRDVEVLGDVLSDLVSYTVWHFSFEEQKMAAADYPETAAHKREHVKLTDQVMDLQREFQAGRQAINIDVMRFLKDWLMNHIIDVDKKLGASLAAKCMK